MALKFTNRIDDGDYAPSVKYGTVVRTPSVGNIRLPDASSSFNIDLSNVGAAIADRTESEAKLKLAEVEMELKKTALEEKDKEDQYKLTQRILANQYAKKVEDIRISQPSMSTTEFNTALYKVRNDFISLGLDASTAISLDRSILSEAISLNKDEQEYALKKELAANDAALTVLSDKNKAFAMLPYADQQKTLDTFKALRKDMQNNLNTSKSILLTDKGKEIVERNLRNNAYAIVDGLYTLKMKNLDAEKGFRNITPQDINQIEYEIHKQIMDDNPDFDSGLLSSLISYVKSQHSYDSLASKQWEATKESAELATKIKTLDEYEIYQLLNKNVPGYRIYANTDQALQEYLLTKNQPFTDTLIGGLNYIARNSSGNKIYPGEVLYDSGTNTTYTVKSPDIDTTYVDAGFNWAKQNAEQSTKRYTENMNNNLYEGSTRASDLSTALQFSMHNGNTQDANKTAEYIQKDPLIPSDIKQKLLDSWQGWRYMSFQTNNKSLTNSLLQDARWLESNFSGRLRMDANGNLVLLDGQGFLEETNDFTGGIEAVTKLYRLNDSLNKIYKPNKAKKRAAAMYLFGQEIPELTKDDEIYNAPGGTSPLDLLSYITQYIGEKVSTSASSVDDVVQGTVNSGFEKGFLELFEFTDKLSKKQKGELSEEESNKLSAQWETIKATVGSLLDPRPAAMTLPSKIKDVKEMTQKAAKKKVVVDIEKDTPIMLNQTPETLGQDLQAIAIRQGYTGNIDLNKRSGVYFPVNDMLMTLFSAAFTVDDKVMLFPLIDVNTGRIMNDEEAFAVAKDTGQHLGLYEDEKEADRVARMLSNESAKVFQPVIKQIKNEADFNFIDGQEDVEIIPITGTDGAY